MENIEEITTLFKFDIVGDKYKITYLGEKPFYVNFTAKLRGVNVPVQTIRYKFTIKGEWFIPGIDYTGCSVLELRNYETKEYLFEKVINPSINKKSKKQNIICIGLNKTGTTSFANSLEKLGFNLSPEGLNFMTCVQDVPYGDLNSTFSILENERYNLYEDMPYSYPFLYEKLYERRPNDIFVLTVRKDVETWIKSVIKFYPLLQQKSEKFWEDKSFMHYQWSNEKDDILLNNQSPLFHAWGIKETSNLESKLREIYLNHNQKAIEFFSKNKSNFIVIDVSKKNELKRLCNWLGVETKQNDFDWVNKNPNLDEQ
jgi:hypothetical protein